MLSGASILQERFLLFVDIVHHDLLTITFVHLADTIIQSDYKWGKTEQPH